MLSTYLSLLPLFGFTSFLSMLTLICCGMYNYLQSLTPKGLYRYILLCLCGIFGLSAFSYCYIDFQLGKVADAAFIEHTLQTYNTDIQGLEKALSLGKPLTQGEVLEFTDFFVLSSNGPANLTRSREQLKADQAFKHSEVAK